MTTNFTVHDRDIFLFGKREYGDIVVERELIDSNEPQASLMHTKVFNKKKSPLATILLIHGMGEHAGRYLGIAKMLVDLAEVEVQMIDLYGYGGSGGGRAMATFNQLQESIARLFEVVNSELPIFLFGHSLGGGLVLNFILANPQIKLAGLILSSPFYRFPQNVRMNWFKRGLITFLSRNASEIAMGSKISMNALTKDTRTIETYPEDKLLTYHISLGLVTSLINLTLPLKRNNLVLNCPVFILAGEQDIVTEFKFTKELFAKLIAPDKKMHTFPDGRHEPHADFEADEYVKKMVEWMQGKLNIYKPQQQCVMTNFKKARSYSNYYMWRSRIIRIIIYMFIFYLLRKNKWRILKYILNL